MNKTPKEKSEFFEEKSERIKENFHWALLIAPIISAFLARYVGHIEKPVEIFLVIISIAFNFFLLWLWSYYEYNRTKELRLFRTFWFGKLPPSRKGGELLTNTEISVLEDQSSAYYHKKLEEKFKTEPSKNTVKRIPIKDNNLNFKEVICESSDLSNLDLDKKIQKEIELRKEIENNISKSKVVVVVRTKALDEKKWVYKAVENWAKKNSDSPCLFIQKKGESYEENEVADDFRWISDEPKLLPWKLLQRAKHRSYAWRMQARFNKAMVTNLFALLIMISLFFIFMIDKSVDETKTQNNKVIAFFKQERDDIYNKLNEINKTKTQDIKQNEIKDSLKKMTKLTRDEYKILYTNLGESGNLEVSYWFKDIDPKAISGIAQNLTQCEKAPQNFDPTVNYSIAQAFTTTEKEDQTDCYYINEGSTIGSVYKHKNHYATWEKHDSYIDSILYGEDETLLYNFDDKKLPNISLQKFQTAPRGNDPIRAITCISYKIPEEDEKYMLGICVFTTDKNKDIFLEGFKEFLKKRVKQDQEYIKNLITTNTIKSLITSSADTAEPLKAE